MATLILSTVGAVVGGPIGQAIGAVAGSFIDRAIIGGGGGRRKSEGPRRADLYVQNASYGEPLPLIYGKYRVAGSVIWSIGLIERQNTSTSGSKGRSSTTTTYSYFASFAVALSAREIVRIERIWADGKLIRANDQSALAVGGSLRVYTGSETQLPDPLIEAAQGINQTPAHRGVAYVVFEELALAEFANRVPNLTFEIIADAQGVADQAFIADDIAARAGLHDIAISGLELPIDGFALSSDAPARVALEALNSASRFAVVSKRAGIQFLSPRLPARAALAINDICISDNKSDDASGAVFSRLSARGVPAMLELSYVDPARAYQTGAQRARSGPRDQLAGQTLSVALPLAITADLAKQLAEANLAQVRRGRDSLSIMVPLHRADLAPGTLFALETQPDDLWMVNGRRFDGGYFNLSCARWNASDLARDAVADGGTLLDPGLVSHGATVWHVLDLPPIETSAPTAPRLIFAASGPEPGWRQASLWRSTDAGNSYAQVTATATNTVMGTALGMLGAAGAELWDEHSTLDVELLQNSHELLSQPQTAVLGGANLALVGNELIQFRNSVALGARRFRLSGLLRGRRGTEKAILGHQLDERFVLLTPLPPQFEVPPIATLGQVLSYKTIGPTDNLGTATAQLLSFSGQAVRPLAPVHSVLESSAGDWILRWVRRSRNGFDWLDGVDAPLGEDFERYRAQIFSGTTLVRSFETVSPLLTYAQADRAADRSAHPGPWRIEIAQISSLVGVGAVAVMALD